jgi:hypothetical protein
MKIVRAHERPALRSREENHALCLRFVSTSLSLFASHAVYSNATVKLCDHMTTQLPCSAVATTLAGGDEAEAVVHEEPAVLRLRRARPLPYAMGIA